MQLPYAYLQSDQNFRCIINETFVLGFIKKLSEGSDQTARNHRLI